jgi:hypothetical protein
MKIAVCISGQMRHIDATFQRIYQNVIQPNQADVFIHSWYDETHLYTDSIDKKRIQPMQKDIHLHVLDLYKPKKYLFEPPKDFSKSYSSLLKVPDSWLRETNNTKTHVIKSMKSMVYSMHKANELKELYAEEQGITYDYIIRMRFDICIDRPIALQDMTLNKQTLYYLNIQQPDNIVSDWFNIGSNTVMNAMMSLFYLFEYFNSYDFLPKHARQPANFRPAPDCVWGFEYYIRDLIDVLKIPCEKLNLPVWVAR